MRIGPHRHGRRRAAQQLPDDSSGHRRDAHAHQGHAQLLVAQPTVTQLEGPR